MSILLDVLRMPPELWIDCYSDKIQRYARYREAAVIVEKLDMVESLVDSWRRGMPDSEAIENIAKIVGGSLE